MAEVRWQEQAKCEVDGEQQRDEQRGECEEGAELERELHESVKR
jgi:hypothetical protein